MKTFAEIIGDHGRIDMLINITGMTTGDQEVNNDTIGRIVIDTNLKGCNTSAIDTEAVLVKEIGIKSNEYGRQ